MKADDVEADDSEAYVEAKSVDADDLDAFLQAGDFETGKDETDAMSWVTTVGLRNTIWD